MPDFGLGMFDECVGWQLDLAVSQDGCFFFMRFSFSQLGFAASPRPRTVSNGEGKCKRQKYGQRDFGEKGADIISLVVDVALPVISLLID